MANRGKQQQQHPGAAAASSSGPSPASTRKEKGLQKDLPKMMYGYGDEKQPLQESVDLLENMVEEYLEEMCRQVGYWVGVLVGMGVWGTREWLDAWACVS